jgi:hypothetical protein
VLALEDRVDSTLKLAHVERLGAGRRLVRRRHPEHPGGAHAQVRKALRFLPLFVEPA